MLERFITEKEYQGLAIKCRIYQESGSFYILKKKNHKLVFRQSYDSGWDL